MFQLDHDNVFDAAIPDGEYEVFINRAHEDVTPNGAEYISVDLIIRNDVSQPNRNNHIFHKIWKTKATGQYNPKSFNMIGKAAELPNKKSYNTMEELFADFEGRPVRVRVKNEKSQGSDGTIYDNLNIKMWEKTKIDGPVRHIGKEKPQPQNDGLTYPPPNQHAANNGFYGSQITIRDEDLPF